jgi:hypothetical protein
MTKVRILKSTTEARLNGEIASPAVLGLYRQAETFPNLQDDDFHTTPFELASEWPQLISVISQGQRAASTDPENAERIYRALGNLKPVYATDRRLWTALTHGPYWGYTRWRYPRIPEGERGTTYVRSHWFASGSGLSALRRNAIARLWWGAHLTIAPWERDEGLTRFAHANRFHYTRIMLSSQQLYQDIMERDFGSNMRLRICLLDTLDARRAMVSNFDHLVRRFVTRINLVLEYQHLLTLPVDKMYARCGRVADEVILAVYPGAEDVNSPAEPETDD